MKTGTDPWSQMKSHGDEWVGSRAVVGHPLETFWMLHPDGSPALLLKEIPATTIPGELPKLHGLGINLRKDANDSIEILLHLRIPEDRDVFLRLCEDILGHSSGGEDATDAALLVFSRLRRWQSLLGFARGDELSEEEMRGLFGEIAFLRGPLASHYGFEEALTAWVAPFRHSQDFAVRDLVIEVKSRVSGARPQVRISSLDQMEVQAGSMRLAVVELMPTSESDGGQSLNDVVHALLDEAGRCSQAVEDQARRAIAEWGYVASRSYDRHRFTVQSIIGFQVSDEFPRLMRSKVDARILEAGYVLGLQGLGPFAVSIESLVAPSGSESSDG